jgi:hypothetical protein
MTVSVSDIMKNAPLQEGLVQLEGRKRLFRVCVTAAAHHVRYNLDLGQCNWRLTFVWSTDDLGPPTCYSEAADAMTRTSQLPV